MTCAHRWTTLLLLFGFALLATAPTARAAQLPVSPAPSPAQAQEPPPSADVTAAGSLLFRIRATSGGKTPRERADEIQTRLINILSDPRLKPSNIRVVVQGSDAAILVRRRLLVTVTAEDGKANQQTALDLANTWADHLRQVLPKINVKPNRNDRPVSPVAP